MWACWCCQPLRLLLHCKWPNALRIMMGVISEWPLENLTSSWVGLHCFGNAKKKKNKLLKTMTLPGLLLLTFEPSTNAKASYCKTNITLLHNTCCILYFFHFLFLLTSNFILSGLSNLLSLPLRSFFVVLIYFQDIHLLLFSTVFVFSSDFPYFFCRERRRYLSPTVRNSKKYNHKVEKELSVRTEALIFHFLSVKVRKCNLREDGWRTWKRKEDNDRLNASFGTGALVYLLPKWPKMK